MRPRISIRRSVGPSIGPSVGPSVRWSIPNANFSKAWKRVFLTIESARDCAWRREVIGSDERGREGGDEGGGDNGQGEWGDNEVDGIYWMLFLRCWMLTTKHKLQVQQGTSLRREKTFNLVIGPLHHRSARPSVKHNLLAHLIYWDSDCFKMGKTGHLLVSYLDSHHSFAPHCSVNPAALFCLLARSRSRAHGTHEVISCSSMKSFGDGVIESSIYRLSAASWAMIHAKPMRHRYTVHDLRLSRKWESIALSNFVWEMTRI